MSKKKKNQKKKKNKNKSTVKKGEKNNLKEKQTESVNEIKKEPVQEKEITNSKNKTIKKEKLKSFLTTKKIIITTIILIVLIIIFFLFILPVKRNVYIELGTKKISSKDFTRNIPSNVKIKTDLSKIDLSKVKKYSIKIKVNGINRISTLHIVDTTKPQVKFKDVYQYKDYKIKAEDFIENIQDESSVTTYIEKVPTINDFKNYPVNVIVKDKYGNITQKEVTLHIEVVKSHYTLELGDEFSLTDILYNDEDEVNYDEEELKKINSNEIGKYTLNIKYNGKNYPVEIQVKDTKAPELKLKNVSIFWDEDKVEKEDFIDEVSDASGEVETNMEASIEYGKVGKYKVTITAKDKNGLETKKETTLSIIKDKEAPVISGVGTKTVNVGSTINFKSGVSAKDNKDGKVDFTVDASKVNTKKAGTYYATYKATDKSGNTKTVVRKIIVKKEVQRVSYSSNASKSTIVKSTASRIGNSIRAIHNWVYNNISFHSEWGGSDPVKYGLTKYRGNCYVHAMVYNALLEAKGYQAQVIWTTDKTHYWNIIKVGGKWLHYDTSAGYHVVFGWNNKQRKAALNGRNWDHSKWPVG